mmetsp:Transcript_12603/g.22605  ORF Transcript_12603/g.22605 Transcript_12603/m.22605 type:complete len:107 (+) Transcript_12603:168-488(+)
MLFLFSFFIQWLRGTIPVALSVHHYAVIQLFKLNADLKPHSEQTFHLFLLLIIICRTFHSGMTASRKSPQSHTCQVEEFRRHAYPITTTSYNVLQKIMAWFSKHLH